jgi:hypothetical protein
MVVPASYTQQPWPNGNYASYVENQGVTTGQSAVGYFSLATVSGGYTGSRAATFNGVVSNAAAPVAFRGGASVTASVSGTVMTVSEVSSGYITVGQIVAGPDVSAETTVTSLGTGTGGVGTYIVNNSQLVASQAMSTTGAGNDFGQLALLELNVNVWKKGSSAPAGVVDGIRFIGGGDPTIPTAGAFGVHFFPLSGADSNRVPTGWTFLEYSEDGAAGTYPSSGFSNIGAQTAGASSSRASINGTTLTVGGGITGLWAIGQFVRGAGVAPATKITALGSGMGGAGTYTVDNPQIVPNEAMTGGEPVSSQPIIARSRSTTGINISGYLQFSQANSWYMSNGLVLGSPTADLDKDALFQTYVGSNKMQISAVLRNDNGASPTIALGFNVAASTSLEASVSKGGIGFTRTAAQGVGYGSLYNRLYEDNAPFTTDDEVLRWTNSGVSVFGTHTAAKIITSGGGCTWTSGSGAPSAAEPNGSLYSRIDGTSGSRLYVSQGEGVWSAVPDV